MRRIEGPETLRRRGERRRIEGSRVLMKREMRRIEGSRGLRGGREEAKRGVQRPLEEGEVPGYSPP